MKHKLLWGIIALILGIIVFWGIHQYLGAAIVSVGLLLIDLYTDERNKNDEK